MFSEELLDHFRNPRGAGELGPPAVVVEVSNPACGDILRLSALIQDGQIQDVRFKVRGCTASIAAGSALTVWLSGKTTAEAAAFVAADIETLLGGLPPASRHVGALCVDAVRDLLRKVRDESVKTVHRPPESGRVLP